MPGTKFMLKILLEVGGEVQQRAPQLLTLPVHLKFFIVTSSLRTRIKAYSGSVKNIGPITVNLLS